MNELTEIYCDGAAMAYRDCAKKIRDMIKNCPVEIKDLMENMQPLADAMEAKASGVYKEAEIFGGVRQ